jgi:biotin synthase
MLCYAVLCCAVLCCAVLCFAHVQVQRCTLLSIKTGGCPENCNYCSQSSHWSDTTGLKAEKLMDLEPVYEVGSCLVCVCVECSASYLGGWGGGGGGGRWHCDKCVLCLLSGAVSSCNGLWGGMGWGVVWCPVVWCLVVILVGCLQLTGWAESKTFD